MKLKDHTWIAAAMRGASADEMAPLFPWMQEMDACEHDPIHHAEGSPWIHTTLVAAALEKRPEFQALPADRQEVVRLAAWLHDVGKPATTTYEPCEETGRMRVRQPGHAPFGAKMAWQGLIDAGCDPLLARQVHALVFWHMRPSHMADLDPDKLLDRIVRFDAESAGGSWRELMALTRSDQDGRIALDGRDKHITLDALEVGLEDASRHLGVDIMDGNLPFLSAASRLRVLRSGAKDIFFAPQEPKGSCVTLMCGLPGSGKDTWLLLNKPGLPVVSMDDIRARMKILPTDNQGPVLQAAIEEARTYLRAGRDFAWNATGLSRITREKVTRLALDYDARIKTVSLDVPLDVAIRRNNERRNPVPDAILKSMALKREPVMADEAHEILSIDKFGFQHYILEEKESETSELIGSPSGCSLN